ncbi:MAG TPA: hypothetical protein VFZ16_02930 [Hyphomicrobiaceae bacterium]|nr:hypothetical protein [Hyphomicrobiaceae bacterium]
MKTMISAFPAASFLAAFWIGLADPADAANGKTRGYTSECFGTPEQCMRDYRAARPPRQAPRGYLPAQRDDSEYDFPRFGSEQWWEQEEDMD